MFDKKPKPYTDLLGKTNRIVEGTTIKGDIISEADFSATCKMQTNSKMTTANDGQPKTGEGK